MAVRRLLIRAFAGFLGTLLTALLILGWRQGTLETLPEVAYSGCAVAFWWLLAWDVLRDRGGHA